jgi:hypothetical protein
MVDDADGLEEGGPLTRQERRAYLSHAYRSSLFSLFYVHFFMKGGFCSFLAFLVNIHLYK